MINAKTCASARLSRDARFDGKFYTAVLTTGIFCRPICPARAPKEENVRYYQSAVQAQEAGYQPCKRCFPEQAPAQLLPLEIKRLCDAFLIEQISLDALSTRFNISQRHLQRIFIDNFGLPPSKFLHHQRLLTARRLLTTTQISISDACFSSGFTSIRRFNEVIKNTYGETPTQMRKRTSKKTVDNSISVLLNYRPPFNWQGMLEFFRLRQLTGVEVITDDTYMRSITLNSGKTSVDTKVSVNAKGWITVAHVEEKQALKLTINIDDITLLNQVISRVRRIFDLDADMSVIHQALSKDPLLAPTIQQNLGIRLPGCWDIFEFSIRAILGQQVSVKAATTLAGRIAQRYGTPLTIEHSQLNQCFPSAEQLADAEFEGLGLTQSRISTLKTWVSFMREHSDIFQSYKNLEQLEQTLTSLKGIGPWTVNYIAMRGLSDPDAFPTTDLGIIKALTVDDKKPNAKKINEIAQSWRPWRAYASLYLWLSLANKPPPIKAVKAKAKNDTKTEAKTSIKTNAKTKKATNTKVSKATMAKEK